MSNTELTKKLGKRIHAMRTKKGLSQEAFAEQLGITRGYLSDLERGAREMSLATLALVAKRTRTTSSKLLGF